MSLTEVKRLLKLKLSSIQNRHNFNPSVGAAQVRGRAELLQDYGLFAYILELNSKAKLGLEVPYDPEGHRPSSVRLNDTVAIRLRVPPEEAPLLKWETIRGRADP